MGGSIREYRDGEYLVHGRSGDKVRSGWNDQDLERAVEIIRSANVHVTGINLQTTGITDEGIKYLARLSDLRVLSLACTNISDEGLKQLLRLKHLEHLELTDCRLICGKNLQFLESLAALKFLDLRGTSVTALELVSLQKAHALESLLLSSETINDEDLTHLLACPKLRLLQIRRASITDKGVETISQLQSLEELYLQETAITDASIPYLKALTNLKVVSLADTACRLMVSKSCENRVRDVLLLGSREIREIR